MMIKFCFPEGRWKALTFSYDDAQIFDKRLADVFAATEMKATFNIPSGFLGRENYLTSEEVKTLLTDRGFEVACHGKTHPFEDQIAPASMLEDVLEDRRKLEEITGTIVRGMAYPFGTYSQAVLNTLKSIGIVYSRTVKATNKTNFIPDRDGWLEWHPTCHHRDNILSRIEPFLTNPWGAHLLYVWGHSFEFDRENNWNLIEEFCEKLQNNSTVWYATNLEIHDYVEAWRSLVTDAKVETVYNPSALPLWISVNGKILELEPGKMQKLK